MKPCKKLEPEIKKVLEEMAESLGSDAAGFALANGDNTIGYCALYNIVDHMGKLTVSKGIDVVGTVLATERPMVIDDYPAFPKAVSAWVQVGTRSVASVPVVVSGKIVGALTALSIDKKRHFTQDDVGKIKDYADTIAALLETAELPLGVE